MAFPWDNLISAAAGVVGGLGGGLGSVWLKSRYDGKQARQARIDARADAVDASYARLVVTARFIAQSMGQIRIWLAGAPDRMPDSVILPAIERSDHMVNQLNETVAVVQLTGSEAARVAAGKLIDAARDATAVIQERSQVMNQSSPAERASLADFDSKKAEGLIAAFQASISDFISAVRSAKPGRG